MERLQFKERQLVFYSYFIENKTYTMFGNESKHNRVLCILGDLTH